MSDRYKRYRISSTRLKGYDYGQNGAFFITVCTRYREHFFGEIVISGNVETQYIASLHTTNIGKIAIGYWEEIPKHFPFIELDEFKVMPNHLHGILFIDKTKSGLQPEKEFVYFEEGFKNKFGPQSGNLSSVLRGYKAGVKSYAVKNSIRFEWQPRFYDRIIRNEDELSRIRKYIMENPDNWAKDKENQNGLYM
jgi:putative transposase